MMSVAAVSATATHALRPAARARARLLVVDGEQSHAELLSASLRYAGFEATVTSSGRAAIDHCLRDAPDLVLLDVTLPDIDGFDVLRRLRMGRRHVPVMFVTARDTVRDKVAGLTLGADDYVTKPFSLDELVARVRAVLRRDGHESRPNTGLRFADIVLDEDSHEVRRAGRLVRLSPTEFNLLRFFMLNPNRVLSKARILEHVWQSDFDGSAQVVESCMSHLRRKVDASEPKLIRTIRGIGYVLRTPRS
jgi:two-component system OmpR family response regulator